jgi:hypothetical protein
MESFMRIFTSLAMASTLALVLGSAAAAQQSPGAAAPPAQQ